MVRGGGVGDMGGDCQKVWWLKCSVMMMVHNSVSILKGIELNADFNG
jgi:hypothetical protein